VIEMDINGTGKSRKMHKKVLLQLQTVGSKVRSFGQWAAANCAMPPSVIAGRYAYTLCLQKCSNFEMV